MAIGFFKMPRSIRRRLFSPFNWRHSPSSGRKRPLLGKESNFFYSDLFSQRCYKLLAVPSSRDNSEIGLPYSTIERAASTLYFFVY
jgi:hypothetical protein